MMLILQLKKRIEILEAQVQELLKVQTAPTLIAKEKKSPFVKPTVVEIFDYACEKLSNDDALKFTEKFHAHYEANGWKVGRNQMKDWKAAVRKWDLTTFVTTNHTATRRTCKFKMKSQNQKRNNLNN